MECTLNSGDKCLSKRKTSICFSYFLLFLSLLFKCTLNSGDICLLKRKTCLFIYLFIIIFFFLFVQMLWNFSEANFEEKLWQTIGANFGPTPRSNFMDILGYSKSQVSSRLKPSPAVTADNGVSPEDLADKMAGLATTVCGALCILLFFKLLLY